MEIKISGSTTSLEPTIDFAPGAAPQTPGPGPGPGPEWVDEVARAFGWPGTSPHGYSWSDVLEKVRGLVGFNPSLALISLSKGELLALRAAIVNDPTNGEKLRALARELGALASQRGWVP
jgi:hypothetical protein